MTASTPTPLPNGVLVDDPREGHRLASEWLSKDHVSRDEQAWEPDRNRMYERHELPQWFLDRHPEVQGFFCPSDERIRQILSHPVSAQMHYERVQATGGHG